MIDVHAWNEARWRERFGREDAEEEINVSIIKGLPGQSPHHYCVQITAGHPEEDSTAGARPTFLTSRSTIMEPADSENLDRFLEHYGRAGEYFLLPGIALPETKLFSDVAVRKRRLVVKSAADVEEHDLESMALRIRGL